MAKLRISRVFAALTIFGLAGSPANADLIVNASGFQMDNPAKSSLVFETPFANPNFGAIYSGNVASLNGTAVLMSISTAEFAQTSGSGEQVPVPPVPEPATLLLFGTGLLALGALAMFGRRGRRLQS